MITVIVSILSLLFIITGIIFIIKKKKEEEEKNIAWKVIGYFILGGATFTINKFPLPVGFIIFILLFRPKINRKAKTYAAMLGLFGFLMNVSSVWLENYMFERPRHIELATTNLYELSFTGQYEKLQNELNISDQAKLNEFTIEFSKSGEINRLKFDFIEHVNETEYIDYNLYYDQEKKQLLIERMRFDSRIQYPELPPVKDFFYMIDKIDLKQLANEEEYQSFKLFGNGIKTGFAVKEHEKYVIENSELKKINNDSLPVDETYLLKICGSKESTIESCHILEYYLYKSEEVYRWEY